MSVDQGGRRVARPPGPGPARTTPRLVPPTRSARAFYALARVVLYAVSRALWRVTIEGTERVPRTGPFIVSPVHRSNIDTILMSAVTRRRLAYLAKDSLWRHRSLGWLFSALGGFPVRRGSADREALRRCVGILQGGQSLVVFPEGARRLGPVVEDLFEGAAYLSLRTGAPIVPVGIGGSEGAMPKGSVLPRRVKVHMVVGDPLVPVTAGQPGTRVHRPQIQELTEVLRAELQSLFDRAQRVARPPGS
ncbi:MAG: lysophospholipid acyltransferase family protein [Acidimicrobiales bacterium]